MKFMRKTSEAFSEHAPFDPMNGVGNLFDTAVVFIAALLLALMTVLDAKDIFSRESELTIVRKDRRGEMTIVEKKGRKIRAVKMTRDEAAGRGVRLGTAYRLEDGSMIYVPEE